MGISQIETPSHAELIPSVLLMEIGTYFPRNNVNIMPSDRSFTRLLHFISTIFFSFLDNRSLKKYGTENTRIVKETIS